MPIEYMLKVMRDENAPDARRDDMAKATAAYLHSKLAANRYKEDDAVDCADGEEPARVES